jgi:hypothetical protein
VTIGSGMEILTPNSFLVRNQFQMALQARQMGLAPPPPLKMLVAPYSDPVTALKLLVPQLDQLSRQAGGPGIVLDKLIEAQAVRATVPNACARA